MSVIGRMDKQVEEVLIAPLDKSKRGATEAQDKAPRPLAKQDAQPPADASQESSTVHQATQELPVWLL